MQRMGCHAAFALIATALFSLPGFAAEPGGTANLITRIESVRITVEDRFSGSWPSSVRKSEQDALINYYAISDQGLLWVDENGLSVRGSSIIAEIKKADDYGLRASDYALPNLDGFNSNDAKATDHLADAEIAISYAVLDYARDGRGGRIDPRRYGRALWILFHGTSWHRHPSVEQAPPARVVAASLVWRHATRLKVRFAGGG